MTALDAGMNGWILPAAWFRFAGFPSLPLSYPLLLIYRIYSLNCLLSGARTQKLLTDSPIELPGTHNLLHGIFCHQNGI